MPNQLCAQPPRTTIALWAFLLLQAAVVPVEAVRFHDGCYDARPVSCDEDVVPLEDIDFDLQQVCTRIEEEIFRHVQYVIHHPSTHDYYLNGVDPKSEWCSQIQQAYSHCSFCGGVREGATSSQSYQLACIEDASFTTCGGQPSRQEVLLDNENYPQFQTKQDIDNTCEELIYLYNASSDEFAQQHPKTIDLCEKQHMVKHLCEGYCQGGCFDGKEQLASCDGANRPMGALHARNTTSEEVCHYIRSQIFRPISNEQVFDLSLHYDYLKEISYDNPLCPLMQEAYSDCVWCWKGEDASRSNAMCFDASNPPSCEVPEDYDEFEYDEDDVHRICSDIYERLPILNRPRDVFDIQWHADFLYIPEDTTLCDEARRVYHRCLWCEREAAETTCLRADTSCHLDPPVPPEAIARIKEELNITTGDNGVISLEECYNSVFPYWITDVGWPVTSESCMENLAVRKMCPDLFCQEEPGSRDKHNYLGTTSDAERKALIWASRLSAFLSLAGASYILFDILSHRQTRQTVYHKLLLGMATFDMVTAIAWLFATAPVDKELGGHIEGAMGDELTCTAQAFFIQLGFTSVFYNVSLAVYYLLVIAYSWREFQLQKIQVFLHGIPVTIGLGLAFGGIPSYEVFEYGCHLLPPPAGDLWPVLVFVVLPLGFSIAAITVCMLLVYLKVRQSTAASKKWTFGIGQASAMEQAVFWQCLFYVLAFYITWPIVFSVYLASVDIDGPLALTMTVAFVAPLQGFNNFLCFLRPKVKSMINNRSSGSSRSSFVARVYTTIMVGANRPHASSGSENDYAMDPSVALAQTERCQGISRHPQEGTESTYMNEDQTTDVDIVT